MAKRETWTVYILKCGDGTLYTGITNDLDLRLEKHKDGTGAKYTRGRGPFKVMFRQNFTSKGRALRREIAIKKLSRAGKLALMKAKKS